MAHLYAEDFSPWCEKARWALDHHGIAYRYTEHVPLMGELPLRIAARRLKGRVTVPLLVDGAERIMDSVGIAQHAERHGQASPLFPAGLEREIARWNERSEQVMTSGRAMLLSRMAKNPAALREQLPPFVPGFLRPALQPLAASGVSFLVRKHGIDLTDDAKHVARVREALDLLRSALSGGRRHLVGGSFSFADITMATALQFLLPVAERYISLGPATREAWTHPGLAAEYPDLFAWRDGLYDSFRASGLGTSPYQGASAPDAVL